MQRYKQHIDKEFCQAMDKFVLNLARCSSYQKFSLKRKVEGASRQTSLDLNRNLRYKLINQQLKGETRNSKGRKKELVRSFRKKEW